MSYPQFPQSFLFGTATAAFQIEGSPDTDGKGKSIWDVFTHTPGKIRTGENADLSYEIVQGIEMGRPSQIIASARKTAEGPVLANVEGSCVNVLRGNVEL